MEKFPLYSLVLYKKRPARVVRIGNDATGMNRMEIELEGGNLAKVRSKDIIFLHPGPFERLNPLNPQENEVELAWEIISESKENSRPLSELAEIIFGRYTPDTAWATWQLVEDGLYFRGTPEAVTACSPAEVFQRRSIRQARAAEAKAWEEFLVRARLGCISVKEDARFLREVEDLAYGRKKESRLLRELGRSERAENAHAFLLESGYWTYEVDPYPIRFGLASLIPDISLPPMIDEPRLDLTGLTAYAIDDSGSKDPDDAISLVSCTVDQQDRFQGGRIWVHIADVAALILPDSEADLEARSRGATLYLPEGTITMLPPAAVQSLGLGLSDVSPAFSFGLEIDSTGEIVSVEMKPSRVRVQRLSYEDAESHLSQEPFRYLLKITEHYQARRRINGALFIDLPEVAVRTIKGEINIQRIQKSKSRDMVREAMLMVGEAVARYAIENRIPIPFVTQEEPGQLNENVHPSESLAYYYSMRRNLKRGKISNLPSLHAGVGLPVYTRATSPLRRYLDLVVHQQLRAWVRNQPLYNEHKIMERAAASETATNLVAQVEALARCHWTLAYLMQHPEWRGEGVLVDKGGLRGTIIIPELALEAPIHLREDLSLNSLVPLILSGINLAELDVQFTHLTSHDARTT